MKAKEYVALLLVLAAGVVAGVEHNFHAPSAAASRSTVSPSPAGRVTSVRAVAPAAFAGAPDRKVQRVATAILLEQKRGLRGTVLARSGEPLSSATVCWTGSVGTSPQLCTQTDESGKYELTVLSSDVCWLVASAPGYRSRLQSISGVANSELRWELSLDPDPDLAPLRGLVADATGGWVAGALVSARSVDSSEPFATAFTGSDGRFELSTRRGPVELVAEAEAYSRASRRAFAPAFEVALVLVPAAEIRGRVIRMESGEPMGDIAVIARTEDGVPGQVSSVRSGPDGSFHLSALGAGRHELEAVGSTWRSEVVTVALGLAQSVEGVTLTVARATFLTGEVRVSGAPCPSAYLHLSGTRSALGSADASGVIRVEGLTAGPYRAIAGCPLASRTQVNEEFVLGLEPLQRIWELPAAQREKLTDGAGEPVGTIQVQVDGNGAASDSFGVWAAAGDDPRASMPGQRQGELTVFERLSLGRYDVYLDQSPETRAQVALERDGQLARVRLQAPRRTQISGRVLDERGLPLPDAWVAAFPREGRVQEGAVVPVLSDAEGEFTISGLYPTRYDVSAESTVGDAMASDVAGGTRGLVLRVSN